MDDRSKVLAVIAALIILISGIAVVASLPHFNHEDGITIGVTWRPNESAESYVNTFRSIEAAGAVPVRLGQVFSYDLS